MRKTSDKKVNEALKIQSGLRDTLIQIASERGRQVNIQPTSPAYVSDLKIAVNEIAVGVDGNFIKSHGDAVRVVTVSPRQKRERITVNH